MPQRMPRRTSGAGIARLPGRWTLLTRRLPAPVAIQIASLSMATMLPGAPEWSPSASPSSKSFHTSWLRSGGTVDAWGFNSYGQLGDGTTSDSHVPVPVSGAPAHVTWYAGVKLKL